MSPVDAVQQGGCTALVDRGKCCSDDTKQGDPPRGELVRIRGKPIVRLPPARMRTGSVSNE